MTLIIGLCSCKIAHDFRSGLCIYILLLTLLVSQMKADHFLRNSLPETIKLKTHTISCKQFHRV